MSTIPESLCYHFSWMLLQPRTGSRLLCILGFLSTPKMHFAVGMDTAILHCLSTLCQEDLRLGARPAHFGKMPGSEGGEELFAGFTIKLTDVALLSVMPFGSAIQHPALPLSFSSYIVERLRVQAVYLSRGHGPNGSLTQLC